MLNTEYLCIFFRIFVRELFGQTMYIPSEDFTDPEYQLINLNLNRIRSTNVAHRVHEKFKEYFNSDIGAIPWQMDAICRGKF